MDKDIKKGFDKVKKTASKQESKLVKEDMKRDAKCDADHKMVMKKKKRSGGK